MSKIVYKRYLDDKVISYYLNKKGKHITLIKSKNEEYFEMTKKWTSNGSIYKKVKVKTPYETIKTYYKDDKKHRDNNKPAYKFKSYKYRAVIIHKQWYQEDNLHNLYGEADLYIEDEMYNKDDPFYYQECSYFINNIKYTDYEYDKAVQKINRDNLTNVLYNSTNMCKDVCTLVSSFVY